MFEDSVTITVHQTVHGYRAGHQLLQASRQLPPEVQRTMLVQSDLSGPSLVPGFEDYLSGYPLDEIGTYALARTWHAPEMERPGCVWTHSLLIEFADLAQLRNPTVLIDYLQRPSRDVVNDPDLMPLHVTRETAPIRVASAELPKAGQLLEALFGSPDSTVVVFRSDALSLEPLVLSLWSQQWPRLRRSFRFCTGSLSNRTQGVFNFDLLVAPSTLKATLRREFTSAVFIDDEPLSAEATWTAAALRALNGHEPRLRDFLWTYGADISHPRHAWRGLLEIFELTQSDAASAAKAIDILATRFPASDSARRLKTDMLGGDPAPGGTWMLPETDVLRGLATTPLHHAFNGSALRVAVRARAVWQADPTAASLLLHDLVSARLNPMGEIILGALCDAVNPTAAIKLERAHPGIIAILLSRVPGLATSPEVWKLPLDRLREMLDVLADLGTEAVKGALAAMLAAGTNEIADDVARILGECTARVVLESIDSDQNLLTSGIGLRWTEVLARDSFAIVDWLVHGPRNVERLKFAISLLEPHSKAVRAVRVQVWLAIAREVVGSINEAQHLRALLFLLAVGLSAEEQGGSGLVAICFGDVYRAALNDSIPYSLWRWLGDQLPPLHWWRNWDRCERLSLGLVERFARLDWPLHDLLQAAQDPVVFQHVLDVAARSGSGEDLLKRFRKEARRGVLRMTKAQRSILEKFMW